MKKTIDGQVALQEIPKAGAALFLPGEQFDDFVILRKIGSGGIATVFLALQLSLNRQVALKVSREDGQEGQTLAQITHENIVAVYSELALHGHKVIAMQYVPGVSLQAALTRSARQGLRASAIKFWIETQVPSFDAIPSAPLAAADDESIEEDGIDFALSLTLQVARALAHAHSRGILHLDVKPGNILMTPAGKCLLADFNVSLKQETLSQGHAPYLGGTIDYMSPEQRTALSNRGAADLREVDARSDLFSLGCVLRETLGHCREKPDPYAQNIVDICTARDKAKRYPSAEALAVRLEAALVARRIRRGLGVSDGAPSSVALWLSVLPVLAGIVLMESLTALIAPAPTPLMAWRRAFYGVILAAIAIYGWRFTRKLSRALNSKSIDEESARHLRLETLRLPLLSAGACLLAWAPLARLATERGILVSNWNGGVVLGLLPMALSACSFGLLATLSFCLWVVYPRLWVGCTEISETAAEELRWVIRHLGVLRFLNVTLPLLAAIVTIVLTWRSLAFLDFALSRAFTIILIGSAILGMNAFRRADEKIQSVLGAFTLANHKLRQ